MAAGVAFAAERRRDGASPLRAPADREEARPRGRGVSLSMRSKSLPQSAVSTGTPSTVRRQLAAARRNRDEARTAGGKEASGSAPALFVNFSFLHKRFFLAFYGVFPMQ